MDKQSEILVYGYGNPGRQDDGLGIALVNKIEQAQLTNISFDNNYQLNIEDAHNIASYELVIFVDASLDPQDAPFSFKLVKPATKITFTTHTMGVESVLGLCHEIYSKHPETYLLAIAGYEWEEMKEIISSKAQQNLEKAYKFLLDFIIKRNKEKKD